MEFFTIVNPFKDFLIVLLALFSVAPSVWNILQAYYYKVGTRTQFRDTWREKNERFYSIIVAVRNEGKETIKELINNLASIDYDKYEVIIVSDDTESYFKEVFSAVTLPANFRVVRRESPKGGKAGALNFAVNLAKGDYLVFLDADARVGKGFFQKLNEKSYLASALRIRIYSDETTLQRYYKEFTEKVMLALFKGRYFLNLPIFPNGSAFSIRKSVLLSVGGWKEGAIAEDLELGIRLFLKDVKVVFFEDIIVYSKAPYTLYDLYKQIERWSYGSSQIFLLSAKMVRKGISGLEGFIYAQQWGLYPLFLLTLIVFNGLEFLLELDQLLLLTPLLVYGISTVIYALVLGQKEGDLRVVLTILNASVAGYSRGLFRIPYKWRVTPKEKKEERGEDDTRKINFLKIIPIFLLSFINAVFSYWLSCIVLLGLGVIESLV
ncbi:glycosyltransferase [Stygiolobus caldivivus]|uniref:Glycosyltransferase 2-like domain-containing protein n=1 Tax=Stygiolobus caldivivus TaxID=2824673 RepID=A0A8D5U4R0_9CREN|nr:glycosyltransferase family 2 protein [Stygiolobus caldivivus]BCU69022.1 hypothetical protein KN1_03190 [Stygiolobus caldivivus]